ncbi:MAG: Beta-hexosaminidase [candidate division WS2 bacterium]|uniref:Beta-hexosaminidase n=1 Tax=Psychracetigena formicireducens TaxID=2986056 RepID=A0A9E2BGB0_PSYF1|nr:Beta-hexosaminidase [Candidatus Psychracetigena formicireducens]
MELDNLTLEQKIGQLIMAGFPSPNFDRYMEKLIKEYNVGNIILFSRNIGSIGDTAELISLIQLNMIKYNQVPAFIGVDQEGGDVSRIRHTSLMFPCNMAFGAAGIPGSTRQQGLFTGEKLRAMGINLNIAPVLDVNNNPENPIIGTRSYGDHPDKVAELGCAYIEGLQHKGVVATAKHFPGHGDTDIDTHLGLPSVSYGRDRLEKVELYPFQKAVEAGVAAVMTAHIIFPVLDGESRPATISYPILTELLRRQMGFQGIIITDCIEMKAVLDNYGVEKTAVEALKAGADMICISHTLDFQIRSVEAIKNAVKSGELSELRIDESVGRILGLKEKYRLMQNLCPDISMLERLFSDESSALFAAEVSRKSITLITGKNSLLPVRSKNILSISAEPALTTNVEDGKNLPVSFCTSVTELLGGEGIAIPQNPDKDLIEEICRKSLDKDLIIFGMHNSRFNPGQIELYNAIRRNNKNIITILLKNPYDVRFIEDTETCIFAYEYSPLSITGVIKVLSGEPAYGRLPVNIHPYTI